MFDRALSMSNNWKVWSMEIKYGIKNIPTKLFFLENVDCVVDAM